MDLVKSSRARGDRTGLSARPGRRRTREAGSASGGTAGHRLAPGPPGGGATQAVYQFPSPIPQLPAPDMLNSSEHDH
eukprot:191629-Hanusia_phi.AAC.1